MKRPSLNIKKPIKRFVRTYQLILFLLVVGAGLGSIYAWQDISQQVPTSPPVTATAALTSSTCTGTNMLSWGNPVPAALPTGPNTVTLYCNGSVAFSSTAGSDVPSWTFQTTGVQPTQVAIDQSTGCLTTDSTYRVLASAQTTTLLGGGYYYCISYPAQTSPGQTIDSFTLTWSS